MTRGLPHDLVACDDDGSVSECRVCGAAEGELLTYCPGFRLSEDALEASWDGTVVDFEGEVRARRLRALTGDGGEKG